MTDIDLKLLVALWSVVAAIIGAVVSAVMFFWLEGRGHFRRQSAALRSMVLVAEAIYAQLKSGRPEALEVKLDWLTEYVDVILMDKAGHEMLCNILQLRAAVLGFTVDDRTATLFTLTQRADKVRSECGAMLEAHVSSMKRLFLLLGR